MPYMLDTDIRLGDVVVSQPNGLSGGVVQYDKGKTEMGAEFVRKGHINQPPSVLLCVEWLNMTLKTAGCRSISIKCSPNIPRLRRRAIPYQQRQIVSTVPYVVFPLNIHRTDVLKPTTTDLIVMIASSDTLGNYFVWKHGNQGRSVWKWRLQG